MSRSLVVKCTVGAEENVERSAQALTVAARMIAERTIGAEDPS